MNGERRSWVMYFLACLVLFSSSCSNDKGLEKPENLLPPEQMVGVLIDIYEAEAMIASFGLRYDSSQHLFDIVEPDLLARHETTPDVFKLSYKYYLDKPDVLIDIYSAVVDTLSYREQVFTQERDKQNADPR